MSRRRFRRSPRNVPRARRPIDKEIRNITITNAGSTQRQTILKTTTFPCTIVGLRWVFTFNNAITTNDDTFYWAIIILHDGNTANTIGTSDGGDFYTPERDVMAFGVTRVSDLDATQGTGPVTIQGSTKSMRKMAQGDQLAFIVLGLTGTAQTVRGSVQYFCKT